MKEEARNIWTEKVMFLTKGAFTLVVRDSSVESLNTTLII